MTTEIMTPFTAVVGAALVGGLGVAQASENPFAIEPLKAGHVQIATVKGEGKCGEGKCGEGKCGGGN